MSVLRKYNDATDTWEPVVVGAQGPTGPTGPVGPTGDSGVIVAATPPVDTSKIWVDNS